MEFKFPHMNILKLRDASRRFHFKGVAATSTNYEFSRKVTTNKKKSTIRGPASLYANRGNINWIQLYSSLLLLVLIRN